VIFLNSLMELCRINDIALNGLLRRQDIAAWVVR
jgi:hypothetical protein